MTFLGSKDSIKRYTLFAVAFTFTLLIPSLIYSLGRVPIFSEAINRPYRYPSMVKYSYKWPDISSFTNGVSTVTNLTEENDIYKEIDQRYCGQDRCRFLLPIAITEQGLFVLLSTLKWLLTISIFFRIKSTIAFQTIGIFSRQSWQNRCITKCLQLTFGCMFTTSILILL